MRYLGKKEAKQNTIAAGEIQPEAIVVWKPPKPVKVLACYSELKKILLKAGMQKDNVSKGKNGLHAPSNKLNEEKLCVLFFNFLELEK